MPIVLSIKMTIHPRTRKRRRKKTKKARACHSRKKNKGHAYFIEWDSDASS